METGLANCLQTIFADHPADLGQKDNFQRPGDVSDNQQDLQAQEQVGDMSHRQVVGSDHGADREERSDSKISRNTRNSVAQELPDVWPYLRDLTPLCLAEYRQCKQDGGNQGGATRYADNQSNRPCRI